MKTMKHAGNVDEYIVSSPRGVRGRLKVLRALIRRIVPESEERISYGMPFYEYRGRLVYFASMKNYIGLYIPPPIIQNHRTELKGFVTTKSAIHFPNDKKLPITLITRLVKAREKYNAKSSNT